MAKNKDAEFKSFLRARRSEVGTGFSGAPVWVMQKAGKRIWNQKAKRHWRQTSFGHDYLRSTGEI